MSMIDLNVVTEPEVNRLLELMLAAGLRRAKDAGSDAETFQRAYYIALKGTPTAQLEEVVHEVIRSEQFIPSSSVLRDRAWRLVKRETLARPVVPEADFVTGRDAAGPISRHMQVPVAEARGLLKIEEVVCPLEGCACYAVPVFVPFTHSVAGLPPAGVAPLRRDPNAIEPRIMRWVWMHIAHEDPVLKLVPKEQRG